MSRFERRRQGGLWLIGLLGLIATAIGIRYANSSGLLSTFFDQDRQTFQTISTGASVQASTQTNNATQNGQLDQSQSFRNPSSNQTADDPSSSDSSSDSYGNDSTDRYREGRRARW